MNRKDSFSLYVFRHAETDWNVEGRLQGQLNTPISAKGRDQIKSIFDKLINFEIDILYSSDLLRARQTAAPLASELIIPLFFDSRLREVNLGEAQGMLISEIDAKFGDGTWSNWKSLEPKWETVNFPNGERKKDVDLRIHSFLRNLSHTQDRNRIAICTHGYWIYRMFHLLESRSVENILNGEVYEILIDEENLLKKRP
ncbi:histidine phosphatase superfamily (branch 1) [Leptospira inadai serovar Lyme str. 10]|uniref:Histidine phosphatase superfamily (Branch 1) n=2 Tax=Leptospira inadai serovar Lyme TaxID=293084 RepID=V6HGX8_9LEPT|nr:histidine phosphatase family protein [Leptospira inadai]EQA35075.1 histidine phosphatase superfamily (branch 1) [Leptospira inadai serovar Lyme str. 10]PNV71925.1 histidine phosphatase family protein [Leptospira inadai serovar Lyme]